MIRIEHTHAEGTLIHGTARGDGTRDIFREHGIRWARSLGCWFVPQSRDRDARTGYRGLELLKDALEGAGFEVELSIDNTRREFATVQADRLERSGTRAERLDDRAARLEREADGHSERSRAATAGIEFGQPILVGHHSERRHRRAIEKSWSAMGKAVETRREAEGAANGAAGARHTVARADSPTYIGNRIAEAEAEERAAQRGYRLVGGGWSAPNPERVARAAEALAYWRGELERVQATGVKVYTKADIAKGDAVKHRGRWSKVVRASAKSVSVETGYSWTDRVPYTEIRDHRTAAQLAAAAAAKASEGTAA